MKRKTKRPPKMKAFKTELFAQYTDQGFSAELIREKLGMAYSTYTLYKREYDRRRKVQIPQ